MLHGHQNGNLTGRQINLWSWIHGMFIGIISLGLDDTGFDWPWHRRRPWTACSARRQSTCLASCPTHEGHHSFKAYRYSLPCKVVGDVHKVGHVSSTKNPADICTIALPKLTLQGFCHLLRMIEEWIWNILEKTWHKYVPTLTISKGSTVRSSSNQNIVLFSCSISIY